MEVGGGRDRRRLSSREASPDRARLTYSHQQQPPPPPPPPQQQLQQRFPRPLRKLQVVYYLCRNGQLEHPHFIELPYLPNHQLQLKDVIERLSFLRGKGMPSLFSWSCKRSYKNGYVWNDLADNDVIYPADGVEYVLKGSEIFPGAYDRFQHLPASSRQPKALLAPRKLRLEFEDDDEAEGVDDEATEEERMGSKLAVGGKKPVGYSRLRGVSTEEMERVDGRVATHHHAPTELPLDDSSPLSSSSSDKPPNHAYPAAVAGGGGSQRFEDVNSAPELGLSRNSVLLQLIACGSAALKGRSTPSSGAVKAAAAAANSASAAAAASGGSERHISVLHRGALSRLAGRAADDESQCYSEHPRYCHPLVEDKEYFSGSIVERSRGGGPPEPVLQKSSSYKEERSAKLGIAEDEERAAGKEEARGKCIPGRRRCSVKQVQ
ncbi:protein SOSEKI 2-like [Zingiber officinale]|uniref:protein SOSEKI 2-like n=1 Tax=Zingiber officinale TaxID=94328 RepID=UPI001C4C96A2|nr:protein SOSEKI 2-like [Zingiber officinale]